MTRPIHIDVVVLPWVHFRWLLLTWNPVRMIDSENSWVTKTRVFHVLWVKSVWNHHWILDLTESAIFMNDQEEALWRITASSNVAWWIFLLPCLVSVYWAALCPPIWLLKPLLNIAPMSQIRNSGEVSTRHCVLVEATGLKDALLRWLLSQCLQ